MSAIPTIKDLRKALKPVGAKAYTAAVGPDGSAWLMPAKWVDIPGITPCWAANPWCGVKVRATPFGLDDRGVYEVLAREVVRVGETDRRNLYPTIEKALADSDRPAKLGLWCYAPIGTTTDVRQVTGEGNGETLMYANAGITDAWWSELGSLRAGRGHLVWVDYSYPDLPADPVAFLMRTVLSNALDGTGDELPVPPLEVTE